MRLIDDNGRVLGIINIIDLLVILLILGVAGRYVAKSQIKPAGVQTRNIQITLLVKDVREATSSVIKVGDIVRETKTNLVLGKVTNVEVKPADTLVNTADGRVVNYPNPILKDVYVTLVGTGTAGENAVVVGNSEVRIGTQLSVKTNIYAVITTVMGIKVLD
ncbi:MAG: DUF4330 domain-containing protein [Tepidanaerobacteraceae bacterium]|jgi:hypothetical protein|nr:DUF4330 domain-containing protein [Tepidanaerobacteraceae bacterium]